MNSRSFFAPNGNFWILSVVTLIVAAGAGTISLLTVDDEHQAPDFHFSAEAILLTPESQKDFEETWLEDTSFRSTAHIVFWPNAGHNNISASLAFLLNSTPGIFDLQKVDSVEGGEGAAMFARFSSTADILEVRVSAPSARMGETALGDLIVEVQDFAQALYRDQATVLTVGEIQTNAPIVDSSASPESIKKLKFHYMLLARDRNRPGISSPGLVLPDVHASLDGYATKIQANFGSGAQELGVMFKVEDRNRVIYVEAQGSNELLLSRLSEFLSESVGSSLGEHEAIQSPTLSGVWFTNVSEVVERPSAVRSPGYVPAAVLGGLIGLAFIVLLRLLRMRRSESSNSV